MQPRWLSRIVAGYLRLVVRVPRRLESLGGAIVAREHVGVVPGEGFERGDAAVDLAAVVAAAGLGVGRVLQAGAAGRLRANGLARRWFKGFGQTIPTTRVQQQRRIVQTMTKRQQQRVVENRAGSGGRTAGSGTESMTKRQQ